MNDNLKNAIAYARLGWSVVPLYPGGKSPPKDITWKDKQTTPATEEELTDLFNGHPEFGVGMVTGQVSGAISIDLDSDAAWDFFEHTYDALNTISYSTGRLLESGRPGFQLLFRHPGEGYIIKTAAGVLHDGIDVRGDRGLTVLPPSRHKSGRVYKWDKIDPTRDGLDELMDLPLSFCKT